MPGAVIDEQLMAHHRELCQRHQQRIFNGLMRRTRARVAGSGARTTARNATRLRR